MDNSIKIIRIFPHTIDYEGPTKDWVNYRVSLAINFDNEPTDGKLTVYINCELLWKSDGTSQYIKWPQTIWDKEKAKNTNYAQGVNKHCFGNKNLSDKVLQMTREYIEHLDGVNNTPATQDRPLDFSWIEIEETSQKPKIDKPTVVEKDIDLEEIKF